MHFNERECLRAMFNADIGTWTKLSEVSGVSRKQIFNLRTGESSPSLDVCYRLMTALHLTRDGFFRVFPKDD